MKFVKMHGIGNDFVLVDCLEKEVNNPSDLSKKICDRHFGVGADGLILVLPSKECDYRMRMFNPDGSEPEMCGNGIRCFAKYIFDNFGGEKITVETLAGKKVPEKVGDLIKVDMGEPSGMKALKLSLPGKTIDTYYVSMGNPHAVVFVDSVEDYDVEEVGKQITAHKEFPNGTNVEFVKVLAPNEIRMRVWERGAGETLACGTGACASVVASAANDKTSKKVTVHLNGGDLEIEWGEDKHIYMTGPAVKVFDGELNDEIL
jgi:diaminopimelate epimerase